MLSKDDPVTVVSTAQVQLVFPVHISYNSRENTSYHSGFQGTKILRDIYTDKYHLTQRKITVIK
jgi:hypothetical protein